MCAFSPGDLVRVHPGAPYPGGETGEIIMPEMHGIRDGYWLEIDSTCEILWVPAAALDPIEEAGDPR